MHSVAELTEDFIMRGKATGFMFRIDQISVHDDIKDSASAFDQFGFSSGCLLNGVRQTGGLRGIVSLHAVGDADLHSEILLGPGALKAWDD